MNLIGKEIESLEDIPRFNIDKRELFLESGKKVEGRFAIMRDDTERVFGVVGDRYQPIQIDSMLDILNSAFNELENDDIHLRPVSYDFISGGKKVLIVSTYGNRINISDELFAPHIYTIIDNTGMGANKNIPSLIRIVCSNALPRLMQSGAQSVRHGSGFTVNTPQLIGDLTFQIYNIKNFEETMIRLQNQKFNTDNFGKLVAKLLPIDNQDSYLRMERLTVKRNTLMENFKRGRSTEGKSRWDAFNAFTQWDTDNLNKRLTSAKALRYISNTNSLSFKALKELVKN